jgi:predicted GTPase
MTVLETVADRQARWSVTADALKATIDQARRSVFVLSIPGALDREMDQDKPGGEIATAASEFLNRHA